MAVFENQNPENLLLNLEKSNSNLELLKTQFQFPEGSLIQYDVYAPQNTWVIQQVDNMGLDRNYDRWPLIDGEFAE